MNNSYLIHCVCNAKTLFKSKWSSKSSTSHINIGCRFSYETCRGDEGFQNYTYKVIYRLDDTLNNSAVVEVIRIK